MISGLGLPQLLGPIDPAARRGNVVYVMSVGDLPAAPSADKRWLFVTNAGSDS